MNNVERLIDVSTQIVIVLNSLEITNVGRDNVEEILFIIEPELVDHVTSVQAAQKQESLHVRKTNIKDHHAWNIQLKNPLLPKTSVNIKVQYELTEVLVPYPTQIAQNEKQLVKFTFNSHFYSLYDVIKSTTVIETSTKLIEDYTRLEPTYLTDTRIHYGPYENLPPLSKSSVSVHYLNNSPFLVVTKLHRLIEISHWGNIAVEDDVTLVNKGAKLKGSFSRFDYQKDPGDGYGVVHAFRTVLPKAAADIYYRDEIGNISTSFLYYKEDTVEVELRPRFPLFGGWGTRYTLGYNLPTSHYLLSNGNNYLLKMPVVDLLYRNMVIEEAVVDVILPEGSSDMELVTPFDAIQLNTSLHFTYLDVIGRPVVTFKKQNLIDNNHRISFELRYNFPKIHMLREPIVLIVSLFLFFTLVVIYVRLDFSLSKDETSEHKLRISGICNKIIGFQHRRTGIYQSIEEKLSSFKHNKDINSLNAHLKSLNNDYKYYSNQISELAAKLKLESADIADKVVELQKIDKQLKDLLSQQQTLYVEKLVPGKLTKSTFAEQEANLNRKKEEYVDKLHKLVSLIE